MVLNRTRAVVVIAIVAGLQWSCAVPQSRSDGLPSAAGPGGQYLVFMDAANPTVQLRFASPGDCKTWALNMSEAAHAAPRTQSPQCLPISAQDRLPVTTTLRRNSDGQVFHALATSIRVCEDFVAGMAGQGYATAVEPCKNEQPASAR